MGGVSQLEYVMFTQRAGVLYEVLKHEAKPSVFDLIQQELRIL